MLVIDKHAAHERVIFEELKEITERDGRVASQALLLPITVIFTPDELACAEEYRDELSLVASALLAIHKENSGTAYERYLLDFCKKHASSACPIFSVSLPEIFAVISLRLDRHKLCAAGGDLNL